MGRFFVRPPQLERRARVVVSLSRAWQPVSKGNKGEGSTGPMKAKKGLKQVLRESFGAFTRKVDDESYKT